MPPRVRLSVGSSAAAKVLISVVGVILALGSFGLALAGYGLAFTSREAMTSSGLPGPFHVDENGKLVPGAVEKTGWNGGPLGIVGLLFILFSVLVLLIAIYAILRAIRHAAWLEGSRLHVRGALRTRSADLATATISVGSGVQPTGTGDSRSYVAVQSITAKDREAGRAVTLAIRRSGVAVLPAEQLSMVANAMTNIFM